MTRLPFQVRGVAGPQGSKTRLAHGAMVESSKRVAPWRQDVKTAAVLAIRDEWEPVHRRDWQPLDEPVCLDVEFRFRRPAGHYGTGRNRFTLKESAPDYPTGRGFGDLDKLARSTADALVAAGVITDDALIVTLNARKRYLHDRGQTPGAVITVETL